MTPHEWARTGRPGQWRCRRCGGTVTHNVNDASSPDANGPAYVGHDGRGSLWGEGCDETMAMRVLRS